jgi:zinc transporter ZupT
MSKVFLVVGIVLWFVFQDTLLPRTHSGLDWKRIVIAAVVGGSSAVVGALVGLAIERRQR